VYQQKGKGVTALGRSVDELVAEYRRLDKLQKLLVLTGILKKAPWYWWPYRLFIYTEINVIAAWRVIRRK